MNQEMEGRRIAHVGPHVAGVHFQRVSSTRLLQTGAQTCILWEDAHERMKNPSHQDAANIYTNLAKYLSTLNKLVFTLKIQAILH